MAATLKMIAKAGNVDVSTVSRALRDDPRVKAATRDTIKSLALEMGYKPNWAARSLVAGKTRTVWLLIPDIRNSTEQAPARHAASYLDNKYGYDLMVVLHQNDARIYHRIIEKLCQNAADGVIIVPRGSRNDQDFSPMLHGRGFPAVFMDRHPAKTKIPCVITDNFNACRKMVGMCADAGAKAVIDVSGCPGNNAAAARSRAVLFESRKRNMLHLHCDERYVVSSEWPKNIAVFATSQSAICNFIRTNSHLADGRDMLLACFDDWIGEPFPGKIALVAKQDFKTMSERACDLVMSMINGNGKKIPQGSRLKVPVESILTVDNTFQLAPG
ncbi:MAG: LacI family DNA-binding transcriptional regulator [Victivallales bacterium]|nr:LacI family DNA-binding transcriptional regulator [Victivallales bacterium]